MVFVNSVSKTGSSAAPAGRGWVLGHYTAAETGCLILWADEKELDRLGRLRLGRVGVAVLHALRKSPQRDRSAARSGSKPAQAPARPSKSTTVLEGIIRVTRGPPLHEFFPERRDIVPNDKESSMRTSCRKLSMSGQCGWSLVIRCERQARAAQTESRRGACVWSLTRRNQPAGSDGRASLAE